MNLITKNKNQLLKRSGFIFLLVLMTILAIQCKYSDHKQEQAGIDTVIYESGAYSIYSHMVLDSVYGGKDGPAIIPDDKTIISPVRIVPKGKTVVLDTSDWWHPVSQIEKYPSIHTNHSSIDAVYNLALDILYRCSSGEFMRNEGEEGMWQAGFRRGEGYGVWTRDVCYTGLLMGSFIDEQVAKKSIEYITANGIDNGEDGLALPAIAVWNHYAVSGDSSIIRKTYENLKAKVNKIQFKSDHNLGFAHSGSFIDSGPQPEAGGFPLSTNILYMEAYRVMALMGKMMNESLENLDLWTNRFKAMKKTINQEYWNPACGYYTFGPRGSESYQEHHWENLGQSLAIWPMWKIADRSQRISVLNNKHVAYNQYGFTDLNYVSRPGDEGLHGQEVWVFTEVGNMAAMAREERIDEMLELFASVIRTATIHKTFQEVVDWHTGKAWRYPGQLWHAMGYISMIYYGILGMEYDESGINFPNACVPKPLADFYIEDFKYRNANFSIKVVGWGAFEKLQLNGQSVDKINTNLSGDHQIEIILKNKS